MDNTRLRSLILNIQDRLSKEDRIRLHFYLGDDVPRRIRDDPSLAGTLNLMESLFDQDKINEEDFSYLINAFDNIHCVDAAKLLKAHLNRNPNSGLNQSMQSLSMIMPPMLDQLLHDCEEEEEEEEEDKQPIEFHSFQQQNIRSDNKVTINRNSTNINQGQTQIIVNNRNRSSSKLKRKQLFGKCILLFVVLSLLTNALLIFLYQQNKINFYRLTRNYSEFMGMVQQIRLNHTQTVQLTRDLRHKLARIEGKCFLNLLPTTVWAQNATTVAGQATGIAGSSINHLHYNRGISISRDDTLYIADRVNNRIVIVPLGGTDTVRNFGSLGSNLSQFDYPSDIYVTRTSVYVLDTNNARVQKYSRDGTNPITMPESGSFSRGFNLFIDKYENLYMSVFFDNKVIRSSLNSSTPIIVAGNGRAGSTPQQLNGPNGIFVDGTGTLYIADTTNHRIQKWTSGASFGVTVAGTGMSGNSSKELSYPESLIVDIRGYMYIVDRGNNRIIRWGPNATSGVCIAACTDVEGNGVNELNFPIDMAFDSDGSMYVSDDGNNRVQKFQILSEKGEIPALNDDTNTIKIYSR